MIPRTELDRGGNGRPACIEAKGGPKVRAKLLILILAAVPVMLSYGSYFVPAQPAGNFVAAEPYTLDGDSLVAQNDRQPGFDLNDCQRECRSRFGYEPQMEIEEHFRGGVGRGDYYEYANCVAACNAKFWREFDNNTRDLERLR